MTDPVPFLRLPTGVPAVTDQNRHFFILTPQRALVLAASGAKAVLVDNWVSISNKENQRFNKYCADHNVVITDAQGDSYRKKYGDSWLVRILAG